MKPLLAWVKKNVLIVIFCAVIVVSLPVAWFFSNGWNNSIRTQRQKAATDELKKVQSTKVKYVLPQYEPGATEISKDAPPTSALTTWFADQRKALAAKADEVAARAEAFNRGTGEEAAAVGRSEHQPLVAGLFPGDGLKDDEVNEKLYELERVFNPTNAGEVNPYQRMLDEISAGGPADPRMLVTALSDLSTREREKITANKRELTEDEQAGLTKMLRERRIAAYRARAGEVQVFAGSDVFNRNAKDGWSAIPEPQQIKAIDREPRPVKMLYFFVWQWDYWCMHDVLAAIRVANTGPAGSRLNSLEAPVKRVMRVALRDPEGIFGSKEVDPSTGAAPVAPTAAIPGLAPIDKTLSVTGRGMGKWNPVYDVRRLELEVIVTSSKVTNLIDAIQRTNFMTVTSVELETVSPEAELSQGYDYGGEHVVKAKLEIESVWLRSWTSKLMPKALREALGIPEAAPSDAAPAPSGSPAPPPGG
ncbi:MAG: hypothetical protein ACOYN0_06310 [Phycisphaerales bacterium]